MPLLSPMSSIAGQLSVIVGSYHLLKPNKGMGTLIGCFSDIDP
jgi:alanine dehydrogenase